MLLNAKWTDMQKMTEKFVESGLKNYADRKSKNIRQ